MPDARLADICARRIGFVFKDFNLIPTRTAQENVETALAPLGLSSAERSRKGAIGTAR
jgi:putative ABC transport system ATP-binding protein